MRACISLSGFQETKVVFDVVVSRHGQSQEEDVVLEFLRRSEKVAGRCAKVHTSNGSVGGLRGGRRGETSSHRQKLEVYSRRESPPLQKKLLQTMREKNRKKIKWNNTQKLNFPEKRKTKENQAVNNAPHV